MESIIAKQKWGVGCCSCGLAGSDVMTIGVEGSDAMTMVIQFVVQLLGQAAEIMRGNRWGLDSVDGGEICESIFRCLDVMAAMWYTRIAMCCGGLVT